jgi:choice-of-anchor B domain-containing protein
MTHGPSILGALLVASSLCALATAHEDDPKILDRQAPYAGPGLRRASFGQPGQLAMGGSPFASSGVSLLSWIPLSEMGSPQSGSDCWGYVSPSGREYALMCHYNGTTFVDITVPSNAQVLTTIAGPGSLWRDVKVYGSYAYAVSEGGSGIQVFDLSQIDSGVVTLAGTVTTGGGTSTHNVAINEDTGFLYRLGGDANGLRAYDLNADPINPPFVGSWSTRYIHDAQIVSYTSGPYAGKEIAFACSGFNGGSVGTGLDILDVTNKSNITVLSNVTYNNPAYSHQGWLSADRQYFYLGDELDENGSLPTTTHIIDVSNLGAAQAIGSFTNGNQSVGHNLYTKGDLIYEANYRSGLRVFDASNATSPVEVAFFDTYPTDDSDAFNGLWNVYPYFPSGVVIGSDLERGLFVWWVGANPVQLDVPGGAPTLVNPAGDSFAVSITESQPGELVLGSERLHVHDGSAWASYPLSSLGGGSYLATFPSTACGATLAYYVSADAGSGGTWTAPAGAPVETFTATSAVGQTVLVSDELEATTGWTVGASGDSATTGIWTLVNPIGTAAQPEDDHSPSGSLCFVTGQGSNGGSVGENDVDGGSTTLVTPAFDLSGGSAPRISYWRWYSNNAGAAPNEDVFEVEISADGATWVNVETVGPTGVETSGGWYQHTVVVSDFVALSNSVRLRFRASDNGSGSIVEAAIDDLTISDIDCGSGPACGGTSYCSAAPNSMGAGAILSATGSASLSANDLVLGVTGASAAQPGLFYYGSTQVAVPFGDGVRCVGGSTYRLNPVAFSDPSGAVSRAVDYTSAPASSGPGMIQAGDTWNFQFWYRDPAAGGAGFNLSDGLSVVFCP